MNNEQSSALGEIMTGEELANYLQVETKTILRLARRGKIPAFKVGDQWRFHVDDIDDWITRTQRNLTI